MKTERNILIAFILNLSFSILEFIGGIIIGSIAILSDSIHDVGDSISIGISYLFEIKSKKDVDEKYTYGYGRFSVVGGFITTVILFAGAIISVYSAVKRIISPVEINYIGMIILGVVGVGINFFAAWFTRSGDSINQKAVNLHMLEDVLGWIVVLLGAVIMKFTDFTLLDPIMSIGISIFILINAIKNLKEMGEIFLQKAPDSINLCEIKEQIEGIEGVLDVHHIHLWSMDHNSNFASLHVIAEREPRRIKEEIRKKLRDRGIDHVTIEIEDNDENCKERECYKKGCCVSFHNHH